MSTITTNDKTNQWIQQKNIKETDNHKALIINTTTIAKTRRGATVIGNTTDRQIDADA